MHSFNWINEVWTVGLSWTQQSLFCSHIDLKQAKFTYSSVWQWLRSCWAKRVTLTSKLQCTKWFSLTFHRVLLCVWHHLPLSEKPLETFHIYFSVYINVYFTYIKYTLSVYSRVHSVSWSTSFGTQRFCFIIIIFIWNFY